VSELPTTRGWLSHYPSATLVVDRFSSKCGDCGKSCDPTSKTHDRILGYGSENGDPGCGVEWQNVTTDYAGERDRNATINLRPDLKYIGWDERADA
jgi:hypothetical protein